MALTIRFISADGESETTATAEPGDNLLRVAQGAGLPLEGTCEGQMACSTCHVIVDADWYALLSDPSEEEEDMIDLAAGARRTSRLSCQIDLDESMDGLTVRVPAESRNMQGT